MLPRTLIGRHRRLQAASFVAFVTVLAVLAPPAAAILSPALTLIASLWLGLAPDSRAVTWIRRLVRRSRRPRERWQRDTIERATTHARLAGITLAFSLAMRPPPAGAAPSPLAAT